MLNAQDVLNQFGDSIGLGPIPLNVDGCAKLDFGDGLEVNFEITRAGNEFQVYSSVGAVPHEGKERFYAELLSANLFGNETGGHTLAVDAEHREVLLQRGFDEHDLNFQNFNAKLSSFVEAVEHWRQQLQTWSSEAPDVFPSEEPSFIRV